jgi:hypothetical protein
MDYESMTMISPDGWTVFGRRKGSKRWVAYGTVPTRVEAEALAQKIEQGQCPEPLERRYDQECLNDADWAFCAAAGF